MNAGRRADVRVPRRLSATESLRNRWPEYLMEAAALGLFMISAGAVTTLLEYPNSSVHAAIPDANLRRGIVGAAMGGTAMALIYCPWGRRSGAHMNPAITLAFLRCGKIPPWDALYYVVFQFLGGLAGVFLMVLILGNRFTGPPVNGVVTVPGPRGDLPAFAGELFIGFIMMTMILSVSSKPGTARWTGLFAGLLIAGFVEFEAPLSGFGMNPARTFASALPSGIWTALWLYFTAPPLGMLLAVQGYLRVKGAGSIACCKLHHKSDRICTFCGRKATPAFS